MKQYSIYLILGTALASAQSTTTTYQRDVNGRSTPVATVSVAANGDKTSNVSQTINGRSTAREEASERVLSTTPQGKVTERITRRFDPDGRPSETERVVIEESIGTGGNRSVKETVFRGTVNGSSTEAERRTSETRVQGDVSTTQVTLDRPGANRTFTTAERRSIVTTGKPDKQHTTETVEQPDPTGGFVIAQRRETEIAIQGGETKSTTTLYEPKGSNAQVLTSQTVVISSKKSDGTETTETSLYLPASTGRILNNGAPPELQEQQISEKHPGPDGSLTEIVSLRSQTSANGGRLGSPRVISETICTGKCIPAPPVAAAAVKPVAPAKPAAAATKSPAK